MEQSLDYLGIDNYTVLRVPEDRPWRHSLKISSIRDYLNSGACRTEYVLFCDSDDAIMRGDPALAIDALRVAECDMLVSCTSYGRYQGMDEIATWTKSIAPSEIAGQRRGRFHLNSGVYVARTDFLRDFMEQAMAFVTANDIAGGVLYAMTDDEVRKTLPEFPRGSGEDQLIFRYLSKRNFPRMKIDYALRLALR